MTSTVSRAAVVVLALSLLGLSGCDLPSGFHDYVVFDGLNRPTAVEFSPDGRIFVAEKRGVIKVFDDLHDRTPTVLADLRTNVYNSWDRGMLGLALHPDFPATPSVYVSYTFDAAPGGIAPRWGRPGADNDVCPSPPGETADGCVVGARVSALHLDGGAWTGPEQVLVEDWCGQYPSHTIGALVFGVDGALYAGGGDGASFNWADHGQDGSPPNPCGDPVREGGALRSQDLRTDGDPVGLGGTIIRVDPATGSALPTNPLAGATDPVGTRTVRVEVTDAAGATDTAETTVRVGTQAPAPPSRRRQRGSRWRSVPRSPSPVAPPCPAWARCPRLRCPGGPTCCTARWPTSATATPTCSPSTAPRPGRSPCPTISTRRPSSCTSRPPGQARRPRSPGGSTTAP
jgi:hypothetical protein